MNEKRVLDGRIEEGDIILAPFRFADTEQSKLRPCLAWNVTPVSVTLVFISSQKIGKAFSTEVILDDENAKSVGLLKPSRIDFAKRDMCLKVDVVRRLGTLSSLQRCKLKECFLAAAAASLLD